MIYGINWWTGKLVTLDPVADADRVRGHRFSFLAVTGTISRKFFDSVVLPCHSGQGPIIVDRNVVFTA